MKPLIVSTFDPKRIPYKKHALMFEKLFSVLKREMEICILPAPDPFAPDEACMQSTKIIAKAAMIFHSSGLVLLQFPHAAGHDQWVEAMMRARGVCWAQNHYCAHAQEQLYLQKINEAIKAQKALLNTNIFFEKEEDVYKLLDKNKLPIVPRLCFEDIPPFPFVFKQLHTTKAAGVYFIENRPQWQKILSFADKEGCFILPFIESPGEYYTQYRIYTAGAHIIASMLCYSGAKKSDERKVVDVESIYDNPNSVFFLERKQIASNRSYGGKQIPLDPTQHSRKITTEEESILKDHRIKNQQVPELLLEYALKSARILSSQGLYILGQDWIQDKAGNFFCLEMNWGPELGSVDVVYNEGKGDDEKTRSIAAEKIAEAIKEDIASRK